MDREEMGLEYWFPPLGPYPLKYEVVMGVDYFALRMSIRKGRYAEHLQWDSMKKGLTVWDNL